MQSPLKKLNTIIILLSSTCYKQLRNLSLASLTYRLIVASIFQALPKCLFELSAFDGPCPKIELIRFTRVIKLIVSDLIGVLLVH